MIEAIGKQRFSVNKRKRDLDFVENQTSSKWAFDYLSYLKRTQKNVTYTQNDEYQYVTHGMGDGLKLIALKQKFNKMSSDEVLAAYKRTRNRVFLLDNEGTLTNYIRKNKMDSSFEPSPHILHDLEELCRDERNTIFIIAGRNRMLLESWYKNIAKLGMAAEFGSFVRWNQKSGWETRASSEQLWKDTAAEIIASYVDKTEGSELQLKETSVVFHYREADPDFGSWQAKELISHLDILLRPYLDECEISSGLSYVEVRPRGMDKGNTARYILQRISEKKGPVDFIVAIGDDLSDEAMFKMVSNI